MSVYSVKGRGWRYDFTQNGNRYTEAWFPTKRQAKEAEAKKREELRNPPPVAPPTPAEEKTPTDMDFLELVNRRLDNVKAYKCRTYYVEHVHLGRRLIKEWPGSNCSEIKTSMVQRYLIKRAGVSAFTANRDLRYLRALFNFGIRQGLIKNNPTQGLEFMPVERHIRYIPSKEDVAKVLLAADPDTQDYLVAIKENMGRMGEINRLTWADVDFEGRWVVLYTRKKKGGHLSPRKIPMTITLYSMLIRRYKNRDTDKPWVFWQRYWSHKEGKFVEGPYQDRKMIMRKLCLKAGVRYFRFHALRHFGASVLDRANVPISSIQRILGHENRTTTEIYLHSIGEA
ncbi:MAG: site-specific integrase [Deltaproteobacteria bacterium]|nr:site-specific integrase [Deltaproteobacteria bacterium]